MDEGSKTLRYSLPSAFKQEASINKSCSYIRGGYHALIFFSKPPVAVSGNPIIDKIAEKNRDNPEFRDFLEVQKKQGNRW